MTLYPDPALTTAEIRALDYIEQYWHDFDQLPRQDEIQDDIPNFNLEKAMIKARFITALTRRGIKTPGPEERYGERIKGLNYEGLTENQIATTVILTDFFDTRTRLAKLRQLGITTTQFNGWMRDKKFKTFFNKMSRKHFEEAEHIAREGLVKGMDRGDVSAIKYYNELTGESPDTQNISILLTRLVEVIQIHVKDPGTLYAIEQSFGRVMRGESMTIDQPVSLELPGLSRDVAYKDDQFQGPLPF